MVEGVEINAFSEGQMQSRIKFRATTALRKKEWFYAHKRRCFKFIAIFGNVWKQKGRKTKTLIYEVTCKKEKKKKTN